MRRVLRMVDRIVVSHSRRRAVLPSRTSSTRFAMPATDACCRTSGSRRVWTTSANGSPDLRPARYASPTLDEVCDRRVDV